MTVFAFFTYLLTTLEAVFGRLPLSFPYPCLTRAPRLCFACGGSSICYRRCGSRSLKLVLGLILASGYSYAVTGGFIDLLCCRGTPS